MKNGSVKRACSIFLYEGHLSAAPTVINLAKLLGQADFEVNIYTSRNKNFPAPGDLGSQVKVNLLNSVNDTRIIKPLLGWLRKLRLWAIAEVIEILFFIIQVIFNQDKSTDQNRINIGVDRKGAIFCLLEYYLWNRKFIYLSLENYAPKTFGKLATVMTNPVAALAFKKSEAVIVQDKARFDSLCKFNQYHHPCVFYLPNSPIGSESSDSSKEDNFFRSLFKLPEGQPGCIVAQAGMIHDLVYCPELAKAFASIKSNEPVLVFHSCEKRELSDPYIQKLKALNSRNLLLSLNPVSHDEIDSVFASITIGLAFYKDIDKNFSEIAMASGKLATYLKYGKPVLVNNLESMAELIDKYQFGIVIQDPTNPLELESAVNRILGDYETYSKNAKNCFIHQYEFSKKVKPILSYINQLDVVQRVPYISL